MSFHYLSNIFCVVVFESGFFALFSFHCVRAYNDNNRRAPIKRVLPAKPYDMRIRLTCQTRPHPRYIFARMHLHQQTHSRDRHGANYNNEEKNGHIEKVPDFQIVTTNKSLGFLFCRKE